VPRIEGELAALLRLGKKHIGEPDAETLLKLRSIKDLHRLERMIDVLFEAESWQQVLNIG